ncbi:hypothetical protein GGI42DRAFT_100150 [Trichoderma sp. SZMC 28013]
MMSLNEQIGQSNGEDSDAEVFDASHLLNEHTTSMILTRAQAIEKLEPYLTRARQEKFQASVTDELAKRMSKEIVQVMDTDTKTWLRTWAIFVDKPDIRKWVDDAKDDMETVVCFVPRTQPGRSTWRNPITDTMVEDSIKDLRECASAPGVPEAVRYSIRVATYIVDRYFKAMEEKHRMWANAEAMNNLDAVMNTIRDEGNKTRVLIKRRKRTHEEAFQKEESDL